MILIVMMMNKLTVCFVQQEVSSDEFFEAPILALDKPGKKLEIARHGCRFNSHLYAL